MRARQRNRLLGGLNWRRSCARASGGSRPHHCQCQGAAIRCETTDCAMDVVRGEPAVWVCHLRGNHGSAKRSPSAC